MIGEITVVPQTEGPARKIVAEAVEEIASQGLRYDVTACGTCVEGELNDILAAVRSIEKRLSSDGVERALVELRLQLEPHPETLEHQVEGIAPATRRVVGNPDGSAPIGLPEHDLRKGLEEELLRSMHVEGDKPTVHAIAHSVARILDEDHLRIAEQLEQAGINLRKAEVDA